MYDTEAVVALGQVTPRFGILEDGFEFVLFAEDVAHGFGVVQGEAALLEAGVAEERYRFAGCRIDCSQAV